MRIRRPPPAFRFPVSPLCWSSAAAARSTASWAYSQSRKSPAGSNARWSDCVLFLENKPDVAHHGARLQEVRSTEGGQEIIQRDGVPQVVDDNGQRDALPAFCVHQIVGTDTEVENVARFHAI